MFRTEKLSKNIKGNNSTNVESSGHQFGLSSKLKEPILANLGSWGQHCVLNKLTGRSWGQHCVLNKLTGRVGGSIVY